MTNWPQHRNRPAWSVTISPDAAEFIEGLLEDCPNEFRTRSDAVDCCIIVARDWSREAAARQMAQGIEQTDA